MSMIGIRIDLKRYEPSQRRYHYDDLSRRAGLRSDAKRMLGVGTLEQRNYCLPGSFI